MSSSERTIRRIGVSKKFCYRIQSSYESAGESRMEHLRLMWEAKQNLNLVYVSNLGVRITPLGNSTETVLEKL